MVGINISTYDRLQSVLQRVARSTRYASFKRGNVVHMVLMELLWTGFCPILPSGSNMWRSARTSLHPSYSALVSHRDPYLARSSSHSFISPINCLPHISRLISNNIRGWHPAFHFNFKNQLCRPDPLPRGRLAAPHFLVSLYIFRQRLV